MRRTPIKVLVVDDSPLMQVILKKLIEESPEFTLAGLASNGKAALDLIAKTDPDVITMDVEMPEMDGLDCLARIMKEIPKPVIMISAYTRDEEESTIMALELGAVDFITKPHPVLSETIEEIRKTIYTKIKTASLIRVKKVDPRTIDTIMGKTRFRKHTLPSPSVHRLRPADKIVSIGVSTGGPKALRTMIPSIPPDINASILIVQHMPPGFTKALADRLDSLSGIEVIEARDGDILAAGKVYIACGGYHMSVEHSGRTFYTSLNQNGHVSLFRPSIDVLMKSTSRLFRERNIGVIMTGMCTDGVEGVRHIRENRGIVIAQDEKTSAVFGMNKIAIQQKIPHHVVPMDQIVPTIMDLL